MLYNFKLCVTNVICEYDSRISPVPFVIYECFTYALLHSIWEYTYLAKIFFYVFIIHIV